MVSTDETQDSKKCIGDEVQQLLAKQKRYAEARSVSNDVERLEVLLEGGGGEDHYN